jgi:DNA-binding HxlR family transcriptional regulator
MEAIPSASGATALEAAQAIGCPLTAALKAIGGKWNMICLYWLDSGTRRFSELQRLMPEISHKVLAETLRGLEQHGLITRTDVSKFPPHVEYCISHYGQSLRPLIKSAQLWGRGHLERRRGPSAPDR